VSIYSYSEPWPARSKNPNIKGQCIPDKLPVRYNTIIAIPAAPHVLIPDDFLCIYSFAPFSSGGISKPSGSSCSIVLATSAGSLPDIVFTATNGDGAGVVVDE
jgi:hypothetical protein